MITNTAHHSTEGKPQLLMGAHEAFYLCYRLHHYILELQGPALPGLGQVHPVLQGPSRLPAHTDLPLRDGVAASKTEAQAHPETCSTCY